ncbi:MAG TPA: LuxR C-terminal-related transcriptional regulator [Parafilimonas sp.]|nr:LuxR C-terminal-related transcriptional regulator [Parafilimonas sp.]
MMSLENYILFGRKAYNLFKDCILMLNLNMEIQYANPSACRALKHDLKELLNKNIDVISKESKKIIEEACANSIETLKKRTQREIAFNDKKKKTFTTSAFILTLESEKAHVGYMIIFNDPVNRENDSPYFNQRVSLINALNLRSDEFCYIQNIADGRNEFVSKSSEKFVGWKAEDLMSAAFTISKQHPDEMWIIDNFYKKRERWFKYPGKYDHVALHYKYRMMHKNGQYVHLKISIMLLERDENNIPKYTICFGKSYTPQKEKQLQNATILTSREKEVLKLLANGNSYKMVAAQLNISIDSVRTFIRRMYEKLQVHSVTEAIHKTLG